MCQVSLRSPPSKPRHPLRDLHATQLPDELLDVFLTERITRPTTPTSRPPWSAAALSAAERAAIAAKTDGRCHICGGVLGTTWHADHVRSHSAGGAHVVENYLAAHATCNNYRWDYLPEEFQWTLKIGVWARLVMEKQGALGQAMSRAFAAYERTREQRQRRK